MLSCEAPWLAGLLSIDSEGDALISLYLQQISPQVCGVPDLEYGFPPRFHTDGSCILLCRISQHQVLLYNCGAT